MALDRLTIITSSGLSTVSDYVIDGLRAVGVVTASTVQVGAATTVHTTGVDLGSGNITSHNINSTGIITATGVTVTGDLTVEGTLAYDDVTNIDSVGLGTFRNGLHVIDGSVGIGTELPTSPLAVMSSSDPEIRFGYNETQDHRITWDSSKVFLEADPDNANGSSAMGFRVDGTERLHITSAGNIGIGENSPYYKLHLKTNNAQTSLSGGTSGNWGGDGIRIENENATGGCMALAHFRTYDADWHIGTKHIGTNNSDFIFLAESNERLRITSAGNIGINNTSPGTKLAIGDSTIDSSNVLTFGKRVAGSNSNLPVIGHHSDGSGSGIAICATSTDGKIHFFTGNGSAGFGDGSNAERMRIDASGNICIGDNLTPNRLLHLKKASSTAYSGGSDTADYNFLKIENTTDDKSAGIFFAIGSNGEAAITATEVVDGNTDIAFQNRGGGVRSEKVRITSAGNVGIGTAVPITSGGYANLSLAKTNGGQVEFKKLSSGRTHYIWGDDNLNIGASYSGGGGGLIVKVNGNNERLRINGDGRVSIGGVTSPLGALHIEANQGTDTALWIGDNSSSRYLAINEQSSSSSFNNVTTRYNDNSIHAHYILDNPYAQGIGYGSQILFRGNNQATTAYIETSNETSGSARGTLRLRGADHHGLDVRSTGEVTTTHASNIGYQSNAATNTRSLVYQSRDPQRQEPVASDWYILKSFWPSKSGTVNMHAEMYIASGTYYFSFRVREEGTNEIVFNAGDNGGFGSYATNGNSVHSYRIYKWICPKIKAHKRYYIEMAATNAAGTAGPYTSVGQWLYLKNFSVYSMSPGHSDGTEAIQIGQPQDVSSAQANSGTTHFYMSPGVNRDSINVTQYFAGTESTFLGWFTTRAYNRYLDFELNMSGSHMWFAQAYGYLYSYGQVAGSMISGYTYTNNQILNKYSVTLGNRGWYGSYRTSSGNLCLKFDHGGNGYTEGKIALFIGTHGPANPEWRVLQYRQNDTTNNIF